MIDSKTEEYVDSATTQALIAYGTARAINAGISLAQSVDISAAIGVGASIQPFQVLDPIDDMVEDYASVMKYAIASLLTQKLLVEIFATNTFKLLMLGAGTLFVASLLLFNGLYVAHLLKGFVFVTLIRFLLVFTVLLSGLMDSAFINDKTVDEMNRVNQAKEAVEKIENSKADTETKERAAIKKQIRELETQQDKLNEDLDKQREQVSSAEAQLKKKENVLKKIKAERSTIDALNIFKRTKKYSDADQAVDDAATDYKSLLNEKVDLKDQLEETQTAISAQQALLIKKESFFKSKLSVMCNLASIEQLTETIEESITAMLTLISLFILKTLIMPLFFLFLILRTFKWLWGIDPRSLVKEK